jgi:hypothetical protein
LALIVRETVEPTFDCRQPGPPRRGTGLANVSVYATNGMSVDDLLPSESTAIT